MASNEKSVLIDTDVLIHLNKAGRLSLLKELFPGRVYILDFVVEELKSMSGSQIDMMLKLGIVKEMAFPDSEEILKEYGLLRRTKGKGESACMAICRYQKDILASSNLRDIKSYCEEHRIEYITTMDILAIAYKKNKLSLIEVDQCVWQITSNGSKLPYDSLQPFLDRDFLIGKLDY